MCFLKHICCALGTTVSIHYYSFKRQCYAERGAYRGCCEREECGKQQNQLYLLKNVSCVLPFFWQELRPSSNYIVGTKPYLPLTWTCPALVSTCPSHPSLYTYPQFYSTEAQAMLQQSHINKLQLQETRILNAVASVVQSSKYYYS